MREEVDANEWMCDVGYHESPCEIPAYSWVEAEGQPSVGGDGSAVSRAEVVVVAYFASRNEPVRVYKEV
jgi:hypothetical protein